MKSLFSKYIWLQLILSVLLLFGGTLIIIFVATGKDDILQNALDIIIAVILFLFGLFAIVASFAFEPNRIFTNGIVYGSASIALGVFLCAQESFLFQYLVYLLAIFFIVIGTIELAKAIILVIKTRDKVLPIILGFIFAVIFIAAGIVALINSELVQKAFCVIAGLILFAIGAYLMITGVMSMIGQIKDKKKPARVKKEKEPKQEQPEDDSKDDLEEIKELDYTEAPAIEQKEQEQEVIDNPEVVQE